MSYIDAIIVNYNSGTALKDCVESIKCGVRNIIIVDNASNDGSFENISGCRMIPNAKNRGFAAGVNAGIKESDADFYLILNPDTQITSANIKKLSDFLDNNPKIAVAGPKILDENGNITPNGRLFPTLAREFLFNTKLYKLNKQSFDIKYEWGRTDFEINSEVDEVIGACFLVSKKAIDEVGLMDELFFLYYEETDWCKRFKNAGWKVWYIADAEAKHIGGHSTKSLAVKKYEIAFNSQYLYFKKHNGIISAIILKIIGSIIIALMKLKGLINK